MRHRIVDQIGEAAFQRAGARGRFHAAARFHRNVAAAAHAVARHVLGKRGHIDHRRRLFAEAFGESEVFFQRLLHFGEVAFRV
ncbi:MAG TPA: hypothetical protein PLN53_10845, partial [Terricaulis sp.]|nr:hypothetical protein [Terricaulis sp.]